MYLIPIHVPIYLDGDRRLVTTEWRRSLELLPSSLEQVTEVAFQEPVKPDREKALALGVPVSEVFDALQSTMSALYVNDFNIYGRTFRVQMQAEAPFRNDPNDLNGRRRSCRNSRRR